LNYSNLFWGSTFFCLDTV